MTTMPNSGRPDYEVSNHQNQYACRGCGSIVYNIRIHDAWHQHINAWHQRINERAASTQARTRKGRGNDA
ncbi:hypothetical protein [Mycobacterium sp. M23085]|uniref:hypothetical protein n=1 Tax=Mycobacterium sp. M23085 TaxID=3378087 RepID=UPI00387840B4